MQSDDPRKLGTDSIDSLNKAMPEFRKSESTVKSLKLIMDSMDSLNKAMPEFRKSEGTVKSLKAGIAAANVRVGVADPNLSQAEFSRLLERYLDAW